MVEPILAVAPGPTDQGPGTTDALELSYLTAVGTRWSTPDQASACPVAAS